MDIDAEATVLEDPRLKPHKLVWTNHHSENVNICRDSINTSDRPQLNWLHLFKTECDVVPLEKRSAWHYFMLNFPMEILGALVSCTDHELKRRGHHKLQNRNEFWLYLGLRLMIVNDKINDIATPWHTTPQPHDYRIPANFNARFGMSRDRFRQIDECLSWCKPIAVRQSPFVIVHAKRFILISHQGDRWWHVRSLVDAFNARMKEILTPGNVLVVDELFSMWYGKKDFENVETCHDKLSGDRFERCPHCSYIKNKPRGEGIMCKCLADGKSKIMLALEIQEGQSAMELKEYQVRPHAHFKDANDRNRYQSQISTGNLHKFHTAVTLRLAQPYFHSGRVVVGDSAFGSIATIIALLLMGLYFVGTIKTAIIDFPLQFFQQWSDSKDTQVGSFNVLTTSIHHVANPGVHHQIMAVGYKGGDSFLRTIGSSIGSTLPGDPARSTTTYMRGSKNDVEIVEELLTLDQPKIIQEFHHFSHAIDIHNQLRQGIFKIEQYWHTDRYWMRVFSTIIGIVCVNAYFAYLLEHDEDDVRMSFDHFITWLISELCPSTTAATTGAVHASSSSSAVVHTVHNVRPLNQHPFFAKTKTQLKDQLEHAIAAGESPEQIKAKRKKVNYFYPRKRCTVCKLSSSLASSYCVDCTGAASGDSDKGIVAVHVGKESAAHEHECWRKHCGEWEGADEPPLDEGAQAVEKEHEVELEQIEEVEVALDEI